MDKDKVKGIIDDAAGRAKRQIGEWTGDINVQVEGAAQQLRGKAEKALGSVKDAALQVQREAEQKHDQNEKPDSGLSQLNEGS